MRAGVAALVIALIFSASPAIAAPNPKAGALCSKAGISKTFNDKKFTCIKRGKKLVWNAGVPTESSSTSSVFQRWERTGSQATKLFKYGRLTWQLGFQKPKSITGSDRAYQQKLKPKRQDE